MSKIQIVNNSLGNLKSSISDLADGVYDQGYINLEYVWSDFSDLETQISNLINSLKELDDSFYDII